MSLISIHTLRHLGYTRSNNEPQFVDEVCVGGDSSEKHVHLAKEDFHTHCN